MLGKRKNRFLGLSFHHFLPISLIFLISIIFIFSWFRYGYIYGGGDVGLPTYNPQRILEIIKNIWWEVHAPGYPYPQSISSIPLYVVLSFLQSLSISGVVLQAFLFGFLIFCMGLGMYLLSWEVLPFKSKFYSFLASFFYLINPFMMFQVWHRFVHTTFFLAAGLPFLLFFFIKLIHEFKLRWILLFLATSFIFSYSYGTLPFAVVPWIPIFVYAFVNTWRERKVKAFVKNSLIFGMLFIFWVLANLWWIYPFWTTGPALFSQKETIYNSIQTMSSISRQSTLVMVLRGINPFYAFGGGAWLSGFDYPLMMLISWVPVFVVLLGIRLVLVSKKALFWVVTLFLISLFLAKGAASPFGNLFVWGFTRSFFLGAFRNSFEKLGILVPFSASLLFALGVKELIVFNHKYKKIVLSVFAVGLILFFGLYHWPMWVGKIFGDGLSQPFVEVPQDYELADAWLKEQKDTRVLHLPLALGDAITYNWEHIYSGVEPSQLLFASPSVSSGFVSDFLDGYLDSVVSSFREEDPSAIRKVLANLNVNYVVLHKDVDWKTRVLENPDKIGTVLESLDFIKKEKEFDKLSIWKVDSDVSFPKFFKADNFAVFHSSTINQKIWPFVLNSLQGKFVFLTPISDNASSNVYSSMYLYEELPQRIIEVPPFPLAYKENAANELPSPRILPDSPFYFLIQIKEKIQEISTPVFDRDNLELDLAGKRLIEVLRLREKGKVELSNYIFKQYQAYLNFSIAEIEKKQLSKLIDGREELRLKQVFARHRIVLSQVGEEKMLNELDSKLSKLGYLSFFPLVDSQNISSLNRRVYQFEIITPQSFEILLVNSNTDFLYKEDLSRMIFQIDNRIEQRGGAKKGQFLSFGKVFFDKGIHEISFNYQDSVDLVPSMSSNQWLFEGGVRRGVDETGNYFEITSSSDQPAFVSAPISNFDSESYYQISFDYWVKRGSGPTLQVAQDSDWSVKGKDFMDINKIYDKNDYEFYWSTANIVFKPRRNSKTSVFKIYVGPWDNCLSIRKDKKLCEDEIIRRIYSRESQVVIKNISVKRILTNNIFLKKEVSEAVNSNYGKINVTKSTATLYEGDIKIDRDNYFVFLETYHPDWKLSLYKDGKSFLPEKELFLANGYGNIWSLKNFKGDYKFKIEFLAQDRFVKGVIASLTSVLVSILLLSYFIYKVKLNVKENTK